MEAMPGRKSQSADVFVAKESFWCELEGVSTFIAKDERVRAGHPLLRDQAARFEPVGANVEYDVEQATAAPGEQRER